MKRPRLLLPGMLKTVPKTQGKKLFFLQSRQNLPVPNFQRGRKRPPHFFVRSPDGRMFILVPRHQAVKQFLQNLPGAFGRARRAGRGEPHLESRPRDPVAPGAGGD